MSMTLSRLKTQYLQMIRQPLNLAAVRRHSVRSFRQKLDASDVMLPVFAGIIIGHFGGAVEVGVLGAAGRDN
jgi:hypothetical protein